MTITVIENSNDLAQLCKRLSASAYITVDTEFRRQTTFWPELCLIQVAGEDEACIIDPLAKGMDLAPFYDLLDNRKVLKVLHAARQDIEIFHHEAGVIPAPLFDTQVAAMVCGFGESVGYETLAVKLANARIDKTARFTDWSHRPLSHKQLSYALGDVTYLRPVYEKLRDSLEASNRSSWLDEELAVLTDPKTYQTHPEDAWRRLKTRSTSRRFLGILREVAAWRERLAQSRNVPRNRIMRDDILLQIAAHAPEEPDDLAKIRGLPKGFQRSADGRNLLEALQKARDLPKDALPQARKVHEVKKTHPSLMDLLRVLLKMKSEDHGVAQKLIASSDDLERLAAKEHEGLAALQGWRREIFGEDALRLLAGEVAISIKKGKAVLHELK